MSYILDQFFDDDTMSVHFKEGVNVMRKKGSPGNWKLEVLKEKPTKTYLVNLIDNLYKEVKENSNSFLEIDKNFSKVLQIGPYRIIIVLPPFSNGIEITVVKPVAKLSIKDYNLSDKVFNLLEDKAKGILISGSPGEGKTTFAQALIEYYVRKGRIVKTIESPRDLLVPNEVTQYNFFYAPHNEIRDVLLLSRPDFVIYDEIRNQEDFVLFKDLRLAGIGLIGVIHATNPVDSIQRLLGVIEMGIIPQVVDTVFFIKNGNVSQILRLRQVVKIPEGMMSEDLARPVIQVYDFYIGEVLYEIYTYGEQVVVVPICKVEKKKNPIKEYAAKYLQTYLTSIYDFPVIVEPEGDSSIKIYIPSYKRGQIIGKGGENILELEKKLGVSISVKNIEDIGGLKNIDFKINKRKKGKKDIVILDFGSKLANKDVLLKIGEEIYKFVADKNGRIQLKRKKILQDIEKFGVQVLNYI